MDGGPASLLSLTGAEQLSQALNNLSLSQFEQ
jgi:hypothetical protein